MAYNVITAAPNVADFTPLSEHQEQTPQTFFGASKAVLHLHCPNVKVAVSKTDLASQPDFAALQAQGAAGSSGDDDAVVEISGIDVWATSSHLILFSTLTAHGIQILYPTITIHALQGSAVLLELNLSDSNTADEDLSFLQLRIIPSTVSSTPHSSTTSQHANGDNTSTVPVQALYDAISACQELHPDPDPSDDDGEGGMGFDETAPGATGWITSENMADFMDEDGNLRMPEGTTVIGGEEEEEVAGLGAGAGRRRGVDEVDAGDGAVEEEDGKWRRTG